MNWTPKVRQRNLNFGVQFILGRFSFWITLKGRKSDKTHEREREKQIIEVIKENSAVIAGLKTTLENNGAAITKGLERIHTRLDNQDILLTAISSDSVQITTKVNSVLDNQREMASKLNKILVLSSGGSLSASDNTDNGR